MVLDTLIEALRVRLGSILCHIDQRPTFGPLIAAMDAEAVAWARSSSAVTVVAGLEGAAGAAGNFFPLFLVVYTLAVLHSSDCFV